MARPPSVTVVAVFTILGSLFTLLLAALLGAVMLIRLPGMGEQPPVMRYAAVFNVGLFVVLGVWGIATAVGLFRMKPGARTSTLVFSGGLVCLAALSLLSILWIPVAAPLGVPDSSMRGVMIGLGIFYGALLALGIWWLVLFNRAAIKAQFYGGTVPVEPFPVPLSISTIAWLLLTTCIFLPFMMFTDWPASFLAWIVRGWAAKLLYLVYGVVGVAAGYGLLKRRMWAYWLTAGCFVFGLVNSVVFYAVPGSQKRLEDLMRAMTPPGTDAFMPRISALEGVLSSLLVGGLLFYFLLTRKKRYEAACRAAGKIASSSAGGTAAR